MNLRLVFNGQSLPVAQIGPDFILVDQPVNHPPTTASVIFQVDARERRWDLQLPDGISSATTKVTITPIT